MGTRALAKNMDDVRWQIHSSGPPFELQSTSLQMLQITCDTLNVWQQRVD